MAQNELSLEKLILMLRMHIRLITGVFTATLLAAVIITFLTPNMYTASVLLNFDFNGVNPVDNRGGSVLAEDTYISTQVDIAKSLNVAEKVEKGLTEYQQNRLIEALQAESTLKDKVTGSIKRFFSALASFGKNDKAAQKSGDLSGQRDTLDVSSAYNWLVPMVSSNLTVLPRFNSRIVEISYSSADPQIAALLANKYAEAYIKTNLEMVTDPARKTTYWFDQQLSALRKKLEDAQSNLTAYQQKEGIVSTDARLDTENSRLQALSAELTNAQSAVREALTRQQKLKQIMDSGGSLMTVAEVFDDSTVQNIKEEVRTLEGRLVELSNSLGKNHPRYKQVSAELSAARRRLQNEIRSIADGVDNAVEIAVAREHDVRQALDQQKDLVLNLKHEHDKISVLNRDVESAQATYNAALTQMNTTSMQSLMDQTNVSILDPAIIPRRPSSPRWSKNLIMGVLAGLILGVGMAVFMEILTRRVHSKEDLLTHFNVPVLGHLKKV